MSEDRTSGRKFVRECERALEEASESLEFDPAATETDLARAIGRKIDEAEALALPLGIVREIDLRKFGEFEISDVETQEIRFFRPDGSEALAVTPAGFRIDGEEVDLPEVRERGQVVYAALSRLLLGDAAAVYPEGRVVEAARSLLEELERDFLGDSDDPVEFDGFKYFGRGSTGVELREALRVLDGIREGAGDRDRR